MNFHVWVNCYLPSQPRGAALWKNPLSIYSSSSTHSLLLFLKIKTLRSSNQLLQFSSFDCCGEEFRVTLIASLYFSRNISFVGPIRLRLLRGDRCPALTQFPFRRSDAPMMLQMIRLLTYPHSLGVSSLKRSIIILLSLFFAYNNI